MTPLFWLFLILAMVFSALFSGIEIAFITANRLKIELDNKKGVFSAKILSLFLKQPAKFIGAMLLGNNVALVIYSIIMAMFLEPIIITYLTHNEFIILITQTTISTIIVLFFSEFLPKALFRINPNKVLSISAIPLSITYYILYPFTYFIVGISSIILKIFKVDTSERDLAFSKIDLEDFVASIQERQTKNEEIDTEIQIFKNALGFSDVKVRDCMIPRTEIIAMDIDKSIAELKEKFIETGLSKILIYKGSIDNIIGYSHSKELFKNPESIQSILLPVSIVPEVMSANEVLKKTIKERRSIAVVVDEFGGTSGILALEDIIEEIFGEIEDEHDKEELIELKIDANTYQFSARIEIDYLNYNYKLHLPESDEYETLGGFIINIHESIPTKDEVIATEKFVFTINKVSDNKIDLITVVQLDKKV
ncbi:MAG: hemolysin [Bacteroidetes bacterium RIFCSPLOWO2_12_FULL_31_6]|nr:MAG: hemolysin [Bacteroidetes bacterium RIFCSPLOWO2_12_FULL_31_6]